MPRCERCKSKFTNEDPVYEVRFGFLFLEEQFVPTRADFAEDSYTGLFHGPCLGLRERSNECPPRLRQQGGPVQSGIPE